MYEITMQQVKANATGHWFEPAATRFFNSRYPEIAYKKDNLAYFITSEQFDRDHPRLYTIRVMDWSTGKVDTVGDFQRYDTRAQAWTALKKILES